MLKYLICEALTPTNLFSLLEKENLQNIQVVTELNGKYVILLVKSGLKFWFLNITCPIQGFPSAF